jgi:o-succinylbenzoate---CoA ligase
MKQSFSNQIICPIYQGSTDSPSKAAIIFHNEKISYLKLNHLISTFAHHLRETKQTAIMWSALNPVDQIIALFASLRAGCQALPYSYLEPKNKNMLTENHFTEITKISYGRKDNIQSIHPSSKLLVATSGSLAQKIAVHSYISFAANAHGAIEKLNFNESDSWALQLPLFHVSGLSILFRVFISKATVVIAEKKQLPEATHYSFVPTQLYRMLCDKTFPKKSKAILIGGSKIGYSLYNDALRYNLPLFLTYGMTETASQFLTKDKVHWQNGFPFLGFPQKSHRCLLRDEELLIEGPCLFEGYFQEKPHAGLFHTHDIGIFDPNYGFACVGRKDRMFISGGENIHPEEIERAFLTLKEVVQAVVIPQPDDEFGQIITAYVQTKSNEIFSEDLRNSLNEILPRYKLPKKIFPLQKLTCKSFLKDQKLSSSSL